jgi:hypothetical protein
VINGLQIAHYLLEFLPFTNDTTQLIDTTNLLLQDNLIYFLLEFDTAQYLRVFEPLDATGKCLILLRCDIKHVQRKTAFLVGFIERMEGNLPNNNNTIALDSNIKELECVNSEQGQIMLQTINHILKKINQEHVLYRTLEVLGTYLSHPMVRK